MSESTRGVALAQAIYLGFLDIKTVAAKLKLTTKEQAVLQESYHDVLLSTQTDGLSTLSQTCETFLKEFDERSSHQIFDLVDELSKNSNEQQINVSDTSNNSSNDAQSGLLTIAPESLFLAASVVATLRGLKSSGCQSATPVAEHSEGLTINAYSLLHDTVLNNADNILSSVLGTEVETLVGFLKEYNATQEKQVKQREHTETLTNAEQRVTKSHLMYKNLEEFYNNQYEQAQKNYPDEPEKTKAILKEWLSIHRVFTRYLDDITQHVVKMGASVQEHESKIRLKRITSVMNAMASGLMLAGPPGHIASILIKQATSLGQNASDSYVTNSSHDNWGVIHHQPYVLITEEDDLPAAQAKVRALESPTITITGPILRGKLKVLGQSLPSDLIQSYDSMAQREIKEKALNRTCCSFSFLNAFPAKPEPITFDAATRFSDPKIKATYKERLNFINNTLKHIEDEQLWLMSLANNMTSGDLAIHDEKQSWPYVLNAKELQLFLKNYASELAVEVQSIHHVMDESHYQGEANAWIQEIQQHIKQINNQESRLSMSNESLNESINAQLLYKDGKIRSWDTLSQQERSHMAIEYARHPEAAKALQCQYDYTLSSLEQLTTACEALHEGRHLQNSPEALQELITQSQLLLGITSEQSSNAQVTSKINERINRLGTRFLALDQARAMHISMLLSHKAISLLDAYHALTSLEEKMQQYPSKISNKNEVYQKTIDVIHQQLDQLIWNPALHQSLQNPTPLQLDKLQEGAHVIFPDRGAFGLRKHQEMAEHVARTLQNHLKNYPDITEFQVMPLNAIDEQLIAQCRNDQKKLGSAIEGLKTEIQWVTALNNYTLEHNTPPLANRQLLVQHYERQLNRLTELYQHKEKTLPTAYHKTYAEHHGIALGNVAAKIGSVMTNTIRDSQAANTLGMVNVRDELAKATLALQSLRVQPSQAPLLTLPTQPLLDEQHAFKNKLHEMKDTPQPSEDRIEPHDELEL